MREGSEGGVDGVRRRVPVFRPLARRLMRVLDEPGDRSPEISDLILADPGLCLAFLARANDLLSGVGVRVTSVGTALQVLGRSTCREIVRTCLVGPEMPSSVDSLELLRHAVVCGLVASSLASILETADAGEARVAGLLLDVGLLAGDPLRVSEHEEEGRRILEEHRLPGRLARAVGQHHGTRPHGASRAQDDELTSLLLLADHMAQELAGCPVSDRSPQEQEEADDRMRSLSEMVHDRVSRDVGDGLLALGVLLGCPHLTVESFTKELRRLRGRERVPSELPRGLTRLVERSLRSIRAAGCEAAALWALMDGVRSLPGVRTALLVLDEGGEAMVASSEDEVPFFARSREIGGRAEGLSDYLLLVHRKGRPGVLRRGMGFDGIFAAFPCREILAVPIIAGRQPVGSVVIPSDGALGAAATPTLDVLAAVTGEVIETVQLSRRSFLLTERITKDPLTGVLQRAHLMELLEAEIRAASRYRRPLALVMLDVDHFKRWNDTYGHQTGDNLLRDVARVIRDCSREDDLVGRYGGDEFLVVLPGQNAEAAGAYAERVRERVEGLGRIMREACYELTLSVSLGVAAIQTWPVDAGTLLFRADHALYRAKEWGRNRVHADH